MGMGNNQNQVYYDSKTGQYYTQPNLPPMVMATNQFGIRKNYIDNAPFTQSKKLSSSAQNLVDQAMAAQPNVPSLAQLFPYMNYGDNMGGLLNMAGQYGAGRFLGGNAIGNTGMTSNAMNTM